MSSVQQEHRVAGSRGTRVGAAATVVILEGQGERSH